jgi:hypothetical protein
MKALLATALVAGVVFGGPASAQNEFERKVAAVLQECANKVKNGIIRTDTAYVRCSNPRILQLSAVYLPRDADLMSTVLAKRLEVAERVDKRLITSAQGELENAKARQQMNEISLGRDRAAAASAATVNAQNQANANALRHAIINEMVRDIFSPPRTTICDRVGSSTFCY